MEDCNRTVIAVALGQIKQSRRQQNAAERNDWFLVAFWRSCCHSSVAHTHPLTAASRL